MGSFDHLTEEQRATLKARVKAGMAAMTDEEDAAIHAAALTDPDNLPMMIARGKSFSSDEEARIRAGFVEAASRPRYVGQEPLRVGRVGRPPAAVTKQVVTIRLDRDVVEKFRESGAGWQSRINELLRKSVGLA